MMVSQNQKLQEQLSESQQQLTELRANLEKLRRESLIDPLTEVGNRKYFVTELNKAAMEARQQGTPLALFMIDIDHFKNFNDTHGHLVGDQVLKLVGRTLTQNVKGRDIVARYGGEEFVVLLPQTRLEDASKVADHLRKTVASKTIIRRPTNQSLGAITLSIGVTQYVPSETMANFVHRADTCMYKAKTSGRNLVWAEEAQQNAAEEGEADNGRYSDLNLDQPPETEDVLSTSTTPGIHIE